MLDKDLIRDLQRKLIVNCGEVVYSPVMYLVQGMIPQIEAIYILFMAKVTYLLFPRIYLRITLDSQKVVLKS